MSEKKSKLANYIDGVTQRNMRSTSERLMNVEAPAQSIGPEPSPTPQAEPEFRPLDAIDYDTMQSDIEELGGTVNGDISRVTTIGDTRAEVVGVAGDLDKYSPFKQAEAVRIEAERRLPITKAEGADIAVEMLKKNAVPTGAEKQDAATVTPPKKANELNAFEARYQRKVHQQINQDLKTTGLDPKDPANVNALLKMRTLGLDGFDFLKARAAFQQRGEEAKWLNASVEDKIGYTQLHAASAILEGNKSDVYGLRERRTTKAEGGRGGTLYETERYYTKKGAEVNKLRMLNDLVDRGVIQPSEVAEAGSLVADSTRGTKGTRLNTSALDKIIYKKETDLKMAEQQASAAKQEVLKSEAEADLMKLSAAKKYWKQRKEDDTVFDSLPTRIAANGESYTSVLSDWYAMKKQLSSATLTPEKRKEIEKGARGMLVKNNIPSGFAIVYSKYQKDGIHAKSL